jgi:hypothetical protein
MTQALDLSSPLPHVVSVAAASFKIHPMGFASEIQSLELEKRADAHSLEAVVRSTA